VAVENCGGDGIVVDERTAITDCTAYGNSEAGIRLTGQANLVDGNSMIGNSIGLDVDAGGNVIVRNRAGDNEADNYDIMGTNEVGTIGSLGTDPWANVGF
jgi:parallel beta-helix repeat protein